VGRTICVIGRLLCPFDGFYMLIGGKERGSGGATHQTIVHIYAGISFWMIAVFQMTRGSHISSCVIQRDIIFTTD